MPSQCASRLSGYGLKETLSLQFFSKSILSETEKSSDDLPWLFVQN